MTKQQLKQVTLVGKTKGYEKSFDTEGDIWCVSSVFDCLNPDKVDLIFQMHTPDTWEDWLQYHREKVIVAFPCSYQQYPILEMVNKYGSVFGSTIAWMLCLAIERGYERIKMFGLDMASKQEYIDQRDTVYYWIGRAEERGIEVVIPEDSRIFFKDRIYGVLKDG